MRGILSWGVHLPYRRLDRSTIASVAGSGGGKGTRAVASFDEDTTTMGVEAARAALAAGTAAQQLWFSTAAPAYLDKTNAAAVHAALRLDRQVPAYDALGSVRSALAALRAGLAAETTTLVVTADIRTGLPGSPEESAGGDGAAAFLLGSGPGVLAEVLAWSSVTEEFLDRWRTPGAPASQVWEERFGETRYTALAAEAWKGMLGEAGLDTADIDHVIVCGTHDRAVAAATKALKVAPERVADRLAATIGNLGAAQPGVLLAATLESAAPGATIALLVLADGADAVLLRTTDALAGHTPAAPVAAQIPGAPVAYGKYLAWRGLLRTEPPRRPEPARVSSSAASRAREFKYGFVGSRDAEGTLRLPPAAADTARQAMSDVLGTVATFTVDRLSYSQNPPVVFAVVDFDGGGRLPIELTDVDAAEVAIGDRVSMTFRRLFTADGIHNYFWKARPVRGGGN